MGVITCEAKLHPNRRHFKSVRCCLSAVIWPRTLSMYCARGLRVSVRRGFGSARVQKRVLRQRSAGSRIQQHASCPTKWLPPMLLKELSKRVYILLVEYIKEHPAVNPSFSLTRHGVAILGKRNAPHFPFHKFAYLYIKLTPL